MPRQNRGRPARGLSKAAAKYLQHHAEPDPTWAELAARQFAHAVIIPAYDEDERLTRAVESVVAARRRGPVLTVVCFNRRASSPPAVAARNRATHDALADAYPIVAEREDAAAHDTPNGALVAVHATLPDDQGVGLARKIGVDLALRVWAAGRIADDWLHCTDADAIVPADYFEQGDGATGAALVHPFRHVAAAGLDRAIALYEVWLRYHVLGLRHAGSPYAFHAIGSTLAVDANAYAVVRGFPRRAAAEDFYLLDKLAKHGPVVTATGDPIALEGRESDRVPFGTGRAMRTAADRGVDAMPAFTPPEAYERLRVLTRACERAVVHGTDVEVDDAARSIGLDRGIAQARAASDDPAVRTRRFHQWLDGIRILKLLHHWRDQQRPVSALDAVRAAPFVSLDRDDPDPDQRAVADLISS